MMYKFSGRQVMKKSLLMLFVSATLTAQTVALAENVVIQESKPFVSKSNQTQRFVDFVNLKNGQGDMPLTMTFANGSEDGPAFRWLRISISGWPVATEKQFDRSGSLSIDVSDKLADGQNQIIIEGAGVPGAVLTFEITAPQVELTSVNPTEANVGSTLTLNGSNFSVKPSEDIVMIGNTAAKVTVAKSNQLQVQIPASIASGNYNVTVQRGGITTNAQALKVNNAPPELDSMGLTSGPPGMEVTLYGKNFAPNAQDNIVTMGGIRAEVISGSQTYLNCIIPEMQSPQWDVPIKVKVGENESKNTLYLRVQNRVY